MLLLLSGRNRFSLSCNPSWGCDLLVVCHGVVSQLGEHLFHSWGCDNHWWDNHWRDNHWWDSLSSLPLEIPINFAIVRLQPFSGYFGNFPSAQNLFRIFFGTFTSAPESFQDIFGSVSSALEIFQDIWDNMIFLSNSAKPTFIYLSLSVGINLVLLLSSDPLTVIVGFACLVLSLSSLASFYLDQVMLDQESI